MILAADVCGTNGRLGFFEAALSMSGSSVLVAVNALLLKRTKLGGTK